MLCDFLAGPIRLITLKYSRVIYKLWFVCLKIYSSIHLEYNNIVSNGMLKETALVPLLF